MQDDPPADEFDGVFDDAPSTGPHFPDGDDFELDAELPDDIEDAFFPKEEFASNIELNEIDSDFEGSSQYALENQKHLMPFSSLFYCFILMVICAGFLICMFLGYV